MPSDPSLLAGMQNLTICWWTLWFLTNLLVDTGPNKIFISGLSMREKHGKCPFCPWLFLLPWSPSSGRGRRCSRPEEASWPRWRTHARAAAELLLARAGEAMAEPQLGRVPTRPCGPAARARRRGRGGAAVRAPPRGRGRAAALARRRGHGGAAARMRAREAAELLLARSGEAMAERLLARAPARPQRSCCSRVPARPWRSRSSHACP